MENKTNTSKKMEEKAVETKVETKKEHKEIKEIKKLGDYKEKPEVPKEEAKKEEKIEKKAEEKSKEHKPEKAPQIPKKDEAVARGLSLHASKKHCMYISSFIKNKSIDSAISDLEKVIKLKKIVPFKGEIPHRKGKGMMSGRYPVSASKLFISMLRGLKGNVLVNGMDLEKTRIYSSSSSWASRPLRKGSVQGKRTNVVITAREFNKKQGEKK
nr:50S ribosomal protein L22P [uncultured archaeon]